MCTTGIHGVGVPCGTWCWGTCCTWCCGSLLWMGLGYLVVHGVGVLCCKWYGGTLLYMVLWYLIVHGVVVPYCTWCCGTLLYMVLVLEKSLQFWASILGKTMCLSFLQDKHDQDPEPHTSRQDCQRNEVQCLKTASGHYKCQKHYINMMSGW